MGDGPSNLTPADLARLDQAHASGQEDLDEMIGTHRAQVTTHGEVRATALLTLHLLDQPHGVAAGFAAHAITRLAVQQCGTVGEESP